MHRRTELSLVDGFRWVSPLHCLKKTDDRMLFFFGACCERGRHLYTTTAPSCCIPASHCHLSATLQTISNTVVNLKANRAVFRIVIALLMFPFNCPQCITCFHYIYRNTLASEHYEIFVLRFIIFICKKMRYSLLFTIQIS